MLPPPDTYTIIARAETPDLHIYAERTSDPPGYKAGFMRQRLDSWHVWATAGWVVFQVPEDIYHEQPDEMKACLDYAQALGKLSS